MCLSILKPESKTNALALGTAGYWYYRRRFSPLCPGFESGGRDDTTRDYRPILLPYYSGGRLQHPGLFTKGRLFPNPAAAILRMEA